MKLEEGEKYLLTTRRWFMGADGEQYKAVFGTTNQSGQDGMIAIGNVLISESEVLYAIRTDEVKNVPPAMDFTHEAKVLSGRYSHSWIYFVD